MQSFTFSAGSFSTPLVAYLVADSLKIASRFPIHTHIYLPLFDTHGILTFSDHYLVILLEIYEARGL